MITSIMAKDGRVQLYTSPECMIIESANPKQLANLILEYGMDDVYFSGFDSDYEASLVANEAFQIYVNHITITPNV